MKILILLITSLLPISLFAQSRFDYKVSKPYKVVDGEKYYLSSTNSDKTLSIKRKRKDIYMLSFDTKTMTETKRNKISDLPKGYVIEYISWLEGRVYFIYSVYDKKSITKDIYAREIDFEGAKFIGKDKKLLSIKGKTTYVTFFKSFDKSKILLKYKRYPEKKRNSINYDIYGMFVFDTDLNKISGGDIKMPYTESNMTLKDYSIDSEGNMFLLVYANNEDNKRNLELFKIPVGTKEIEITNIKKEKGLLDIGLYESSSNNMVCAGYYNDNKTSNAEGLFLFDINLEEEYIDQVYYEIPTEIIKQYSSKQAQKKQDKKTKKGRGGFEELELRKVISQEDGSTIMIGEQYYVVVHTYTDSNGNTRTRYTYYYNDILVTKINSEGEIEWIKKLPKRQVGSAGKGSMGFKHITLDNQHYFIFLDNVKNMDLALDEFPATHSDRKGGYLTAYKVDDETGTIKKVSIFDTKDVGGYKAYQFNTSRILPISENQFVIEFYKKGKEDIMVKVDVR